jgi:Cys-tRNA(Pro)/Cys-tRNA(Cys) deacylase
MAKIKKTNAMRILDRNKVDYTILSADSSDEKIDGRALASKHGKNTLLVHKALVAKAVSKELYVFIIPVSEVLDLKKAAFATGEKKIEMIAEKNLLPFTGYVKGGCSPLGMKKQYPTFLNLGAHDLECIIVSGGKIGMQVRLAVPDLLNIVGGELSDLIK